MKTITKFSIYAVVLLGVVFLTAKLIEGRKTSNCYRVAAFANVLFSEIYGFDSEVFPDLEKTDSYQSQPAQLKKLISKARIDSSFIYSPKAVRDIRHFDSDASSGKSNQVFLRLKIYENYVECDTGGKVTVSKTSL